MDTIIINKIIAPSISSRDAVLIVTESIEKSKSKKISLDFSNVRFISRSAAQELLNIKKRYSQRFFFSKDIIFENVPEAISQMLFLANQLPNKKKRWVPDAMKSIPFEQLFLSDSPKSAITAKRNE
ncbi:MAG: hypothetical protein V1685_03995 [Parcubacteria group bacterium]